MVSVRSTLVHFCCGAKIYHFMFYYILICDLVFYVFIKVRLLCYINLISPTFIRPHCEKKISLLRLFQPNFQSAVKCYEILHFYLYLIKYFFSLSTSVTHTQSLKLFNR